VRHDVEEGPGRFFEVDGVEFVEPTRDEQGLLSNAAGFYAVACRCMCTDNQVFPDLAPSFRTFHLDGVTMVRPAPLTGRTGAVRTARPGPPTGVR
jgi:hypothetical protein